MAEKTLTIKILGDISGLQSSLAKIGPALSGIAGAAVLFGKNAVEAFAESERATKQLEAVLASTQGVAGVTKQEVEGLSTSLSQLTGIDDEAITGAQSMLLTFTNISKQVFPDTTKAVLDMATAMNGGAIPTAETLRQTAIQVGKALQDPVEGVTALQRVGVRLTESQKDLIKSLVEMGKTAEAQTVILRELQKEFGGSAKAAGETFQGALAKARVEAQNFNEDVGQTITSVLGPLVQQFPSATVAIVGTSDAISGLNVTTGDLLIAGPRLLDALGGWSGALLALGQAASIAGAALAGWEIGRFIGQLELGGQSIDKWAEKLFSLTTYSIQNATALKENEVAINRMAGALKTPVVRQAGEDWDQFSKRVLDAAKNEAEAATHQAQLSTVMQQSTAVVKSHVITLSEQIAKQKQLVESLKTQEGKSKELTEAVAKLEALQKKQADATAKSRQEIEGWGAAIGVAIPKLRQNVAEGEKYVAYLKRSGASAQEVREAEEKLAQARLALTKATSPLIQETQRLLEATKNLDKVQIDNAETHKAAAENAQRLTEELHSLGIVAGVELPEEFGKPTTALLDLNAAFKTLGITSQSALDNAAQEAVAAFESIRDSGMATTRDISLAWVAMTEAQIAAGERVSAETLRTVDAIKQKYGGLKDDRNANLTTWRELASRQVSTLVSDVSKGFADIIVGAGSFGSKMIAMFKQIGQGMLQAFFESGIGGLLSGKGFAGFTGFAGGLVDAIKGLFGGKGGGALPQLGGMIGAAGIPGFGGGVTATTPPFVLTGSSGQPPLGGIAGPGAPAYPGGPPVGTTAGMGTGLATLTGAGAGFGGGMAFGSLFGLGQKGSIFSGIAGAGGGAIAGLLAAGSLAGPIGLGVGAAAAGIGALVGHFTRRGREKETATAAAEELSRVVWQEIIPSAQKGIITAEQADQTIRQLWAQYEDFLKANLKDQVVIQRSIDGQKQTLTEGLAAVEALRAKEQETSAARAELDNLIKEFTETGAITGALSEKIQELGGNLGPFKEALRLPELAAAQSQFGALRGELEKLKPTSEDIISSFIQTGEVSDALRAKIEEFGGSASVFEQFASVRTMRDDFLSLQQSILNTGQGLDEIRPIFEQMGVSMDALEAAAALPGLQGLRGEFASLAEEINKLLPVTLTWQQQFLQTGVITDEMREKIAQAGGDLSVFNKAAAEIQAGGLSESTANIVSTELGKMTKGLDEQIAELSEGLTKALDEVGTKLDAAFEDSRVALVDQLDSLDKNLGDTIGSLQSALQTEVSNLTAAISNIAIPDEITVNVQQQAAPAPASQTFTPPEQSSPYTYGPYNPYAPEPLPGSAGYAFGGAFAEGGEGIVRKPTVFIAGEAGPERFSFTPLGSEYEQSEALVRASTMLLMPAVLERIQSGFERLEASLKTSIVDNSRSDQRTVNMPISIYNSGDDPFRIRREMDRFKADLLNSLA